MKEACAHLKQMIDHRLASFLHEDGFSTIDKRSARDEYCVVFMESDQVRMRFHYSPDYVDISVAPLNAPLTWWEDDVDGERKWYSVATVIDFLRGDSDPMMPSIEQWEKMTLERQFEQLASGLIQYIEPIKSIFGSDLGSVRHQQELDDHIQTQQRAARQQYEALARSARDN